MKYLNLLLIASAFFVNAVNATEHTDKACVKIKQCAVSDAAAEHIPVYMQAFVIQLIDNQCETMANRYNAQFEEAGLQDKANACVDSIVDQSCEVLIATQGQPNTQSCKDFETAANDAGIELK